MLTSIGILKFVAVKMEKTPVFVPLRNILTAELVEDEPSKFTSEKILKVDYTDPENTNRLVSMLLSSENVN